VQFHAITFTITAIQLAAAAFFPHNNYESFTLSFLNPHVVIMNSLLLNF